MKQDITRLDKEELIHLAIDASVRNAHADAIDLLKRLLEIAPEDAKAHFLIGAEYAQIGMFERSFEHLNKTLEIDADMHIARFQLGLLYLTSGRIAEASITWAALDQLGDSNYLFLFKSGLENLASDQFDVCRDYLSRGIALNVENQALTTDMRRILDDLPAQGATDQAAGETNAFFLSAYTGNTH